MTYPDIDPVAISLGPFQVHWYGLMYVIGFVAAWWLGRRRAARFGLSGDDVGDLLFYAAIGVVLGGRLGYALFYGMGQWLADPLWILRIWDGGMSFHGGLIGVLLAALYFARKKRMAFFTLTDFIAPLVPIGLGAGRIGNFINRELPGRVTELPWACPFPAWGPSRATPRRFTRPSSRGWCCSWCCGGCRPSPVPAAWSPGSSCCSTGVPLQCGVRAPARRPYRLHRLRLGDHGHAADPADDRLRHHPDPLVAPAAGGCQNTSPIHREICSSIRMVSDAIDAGTSGNHQAVGGRGVRR